MWRTGWADWKAGGEALALLSEPPPPERGMFLGATSNPVPAVGAASHGAASAHVETGSAEARRAAIKRRKQRVRTVSTLLGVVALAMLVLLVVVLAR